MEMLSNLKILCVEDDEFARGEMVSFLKKRAGKVFSAENGEEGIRQYDVHKPDIVIADLLMPGMDGMEMLRKLREEDKKMHAIVVTSVKELDTVLESIDLGVDNYIIKPVEFDELERKLSKIAEEILMQRGTVSGRLGSIEDKKAVEDAIKKDFIKALKAYMGKGPKEIVVQLTGREVDILVMDPLTVMETNMLQDRKNHEIIRQGRNIAYEAVCMRFAVHLSQLLNMDVRFDKAEIDLKKKIDKIKFVV